MYYICICLILNFDSHIYDTQWPKWGREYDERERHMWQNILCSMALPTYRISASTITVVWFKDKGFYNGELLLVLVGPWMISDAGSDEDHSCADILHFPKSQTAAACGAGTNVGDRSAPKCNKFWMQMPSMSASHLVFWQNMATKTWHTLNPLCWHKILSANCQNLLCQNGVTENH